MIRRLLQVLLPVVVIGAGVYGAKRLTESYEPPQKEPIQVQPPLVRVQQVDLESIQLRIEAEGSVRPRAESEITPEVAGRLTWVSPDLVVGGFVDEGQELLRIDRRDYELAVVRARAEVAQAELRVATEEQEAAVARREWESLGEGEATPLVLRKPQLAQANAELASAQAALEQSEFDLERTVVLAPFDARVRSEQVDQGQFVQRGQALAAIYSTDVAEVLLPIPDDQLAFVNLPLAYRDQAARGQEAVRTGPRVVLTTDFAGREHSWSGRIVRTQGEVDPQTRMIQAIAQVDDPYSKARRTSRPPLAIGMFVQAEIMGRYVRMIALDRTVLRGDNMVWVVNERNRIEFRELDIYRRERDRVLVQGGIDPGEIVCVSTLEAAVNGMEVRVLSDDNPEVRIQGL